MPDSDLFWTGNDADLFWEGEDATLFWGDPGLIPPTSGIIVARPFVRLVIAPPRGVQTPVAMTPMLEPYFSKQPFQALDLPVDWGVRWPDAFPSITSGVAVVYERILDATGEVELVDVTAQMAPQPSLAIFGKVTSVRIEGGVSGHEYALAYRIQLSDGQADEQDRIIQVQDEH